MLKHVFRIILAPFMMTARLMLGLAAFITSIASSVIGLTVSVFAVLFPPIRIRMKTARQGNLGRRRRECKPLQMGEFLSVAGG